MALAAFTETNVANSLSLYLASQLLAAGYLIYWHSIDAVQTNDGWYYQYSTKQATYATDPTFSAALSTAKGLLTLKGKTTSVPEFPVRPTGNGTVTTQDELQVPWLGVEIGPAVPGQLAGLGDRMRWRYRTLTIFGLTRNEAEQSWIRDSLAEWFDETSFLEVYNHDDGSLTDVGVVETQDVIPDSAIIGTTPEASRFEVILSARLQYEA